jgi:hypothetical protein
LTALFFLKERAEGSILLTFCAGQTSPLLLPALWGLCSRSRTPLSNSASPLELTTCSVGKFVLKERFSSRFRQCPPITGPSVRGTSRNAAPESRVGGEMTRLPTRVGVKSGHARRRNRSISHDGVQGPRALQNESGIST